MTQEAVAEKAGFEKAYVSKWENKNDDSIPPLATIEAFARALGTTLLEPLVSLGFIRPDEASLPEGFAKSEFALMFKDVEKLRPQQRRDFKIAWDMAKDALKRIKKGK